VPSFQSYQPYRSSLKKKVLPKSGRLLGLAVAVDGGVDAEVARAGEVEAVELGLPLGGRVDGVEVPVVADRLVALEDDSLLTPAPSPWP
jgi:hypothetical protein